MPTSLFSLSLSLPLFSLSLQGNATGGSEEAEKFKYGK